MSNNNSTNQSETFNPLNHSSIRDVIAADFFALGENCIFYNRSENRKQKLTKNDPEELVRLETYFDLVTKYKYDSVCIGVEVSIMVG